MLRRKFLLYLAPLIALMLIIAVAAIWQLQGVLREVEHIHQEAWRAVEDVNDLGIAVGLVEVDLYELEMNRERHLDRLITSLAHLRQLTEGLGGHYIFHEQEGADHYERIMSLMPRFLSLIGTLATIEDGDVAREYADEVLAMALKLRQSVLEAGRFVRDHAQQEQEALGQSLRWLVLGLGVAFLVIINLSVLVLLRMAAMVLQPVDQLLAATDAVGQGRFDVRVDLGGRDEFSLLAQAYNAMADRLAAAEQRRMETIAQTALALNHELNNSMSIIELQLQLMSRQASGNPAAEKCLKQIRLSLQRMTGTVESLKRVRRIVLTDYLPGTKMLDLERSTEEEQQETVTVR